MAKRIDWYYHRKGWTSCKRADSFVEGRAATVRETVDAGKNRFGKQDLKALFAGATRIVVAKGKKVLTFDPRKDALADIVAVALGPTGNLRAPAIRTGTRWLIGFNEEAYDEVLTS